MTSLPSGMWATLANGFYLTINRNSSGFINVRLEDLNANLVYSVSTTAAVTYASSTILWAMYCETANGTPGALMYRGLTLEATTTSGTWSDWHDAFGPVLSY